jgi:hypothetical protein
MVRETLGRHAGAVYMTNDKFSMTDFQSSQSLKPFPGHRSAKESEMRSQMIEPGELICTVRQSVLNMFESGPNSPAWPFNKEKVDSLRPV